MNEIPSTVKVGAMTYTVEIIPKMLEDRSLFGEVLYGPQVIKIAGDVNAPRQFNAFLHELTHAIIFEAGINVERASEEEFVNAFSNLLTSVVVDNGWNFGITKEVGE